MYFKNRKHRHSFNFNWHFLFALIVIVAICFFAISFFSRPAETIKPHTSTLLGNIGVIVLWIAGLFGVFAILALLFEIVQGIQSNNEKLENSVEMLSRQNNLLMQITMASQLSDTAKEIVFRDTEQMELGEAALTKLHQHDFDDADAMIAAMAESPKYKELSERLKRMSEKYRSATEEGRINQIIAHIEGLFEQKLWIQAAAQIDNLIHMFPHSEKAKLMTKRLNERKDRHKRELLADWDIAVREKNTDKSLEILKELDLYLTPNEALALQESASSVFKTKLHNLGVEFSVAIAESHWSKALQTGREIVQNFPNSRMAVEIRGKMDILLERAKKEAVNKTPEPAGEQS
jgi:outer membrane protein assembly factor BamD (BamD/ComL family)